MAVESTGTNIGYPLLEWVLPDSEGHPTQVKQDGSLATLIAFVCNHCPYVQHIESAFGEMVARYSEQGLRTLAVVSNDLVEYPDDGVEGMKAQIDRAGWEFPYLLDSDQSFALELGAVCTPDFFLFDRDFALAYRGAFDGSSPKNGTPVTGELLEDAIMLTLRGAPVALPHRPAMGCGIKWLSGNEPEAQ
jgi:thiol-disulfide isomerase/thioredoxin